MKILPEKPRKNFQRGGGMSNLHKMKKTKHTPINFSMAKRLSEIDAKYLNRYCNFPDIGFYSMWDIYMISPVFINMFKEVKK